MVEKILQPSKSYDLTLLVNNDSKTLYSLYLEEVRIITSIATSWNVVYLFIFIPSHVILTDKLFGQDILTLKIDFLGIDGIIKETTTMDLLMLSSDFSIPITSEIAAIKQEDRSIMKITAVSKDPFLEMTSMVNKVYGVHMNPMNVKQIIDDLVSTTSKKLNIEWGKGYNEEIIRQVCIPPTTLNDAIYYLRDFFGIFNGPAVIFCRNDNTLIIKNLNEEMSKEPIFSITQISTTENEVLKKEDEKNMITYDNIFTSYTGNSKIGYHGKDINIVINPADKLYKIISLDLEDISKNNSCSDGTEIHIFKDLQRKTYYSGHGGFEESDMFARSSLAKDVCNSTRTRITIIRNIFLKPLFNVGSAIQLIIKTLEHKVIGKKYIMFSSDITMKRVESGWSSTATIELMKTNRTV